MEYVYAAMLLHKAGKPIDEGNVKKILQAVGIQADLARVKALVAAVSEIDIGDAIKSALTSMSTAVPAAPTEQAASKTEDKPKKEEKKEEEVLEGLGALFG